MFSAYELISNLYVRGRGGGTYNNTVANIRRHFTKFSFPGDQASVTFALLSYYTLHGL